MRSSGKATIEELFDLETRKIITSFQFFSQSFDVIIQARGKQEKIIEGLRTP